MTGTLDRIEADNAWARERGHQRSLLSVVEAEALVEVAKAAQEAANPMTPDGPAAPFMWKPANDALAAALARLEDNQ